MGLFQDIHLPIQRLEYNLISFINKFKFYSLKMKLLFSADDNVPVDFSIAIAFLS